jgi:hypothetical protein
MKLQETDEYELSVYERLIYSGDYVDENFLHRFEHRRTTFPSRVFRRAVNHQIFTLRRWLRERLKTQAFSLDHHPIHFSALRRIFLKQQGINPDQLSQEHITVELLRAWQEFHGAFAEYRVTTVSFNHLEGIQHGDFCHSRDVRLDSAIIELLHQN